LGEQPSTNSFTSNPNRLDRLHESGYTHEPATKAKSVMLTEEGPERSKRLFEKHFMTD